MKVSRIFGFFGVLVACIIAGGAAPSAKAQSFTTLYTFCSQSKCADGAYPYAPVLQGTDGDYYGTTEAGGAGPFCTDFNGCGTVFKITPTGVLTTLYSFCSQSACADGKHPFASLILASDGNFYGTTLQGGNNSASSNGSGTIFKITPSGTFNTVYTFCSLSYCADGAGPYDSLVQGSDGNFYGTTSAGGGPYGLGTVFKITPDSVFTSLYSFCDHFECATIGDPQGGLVQAGDGNFYGTTGGITGGTAHSTVFRITPSGALSYIYSFCQLGGTCVDGFHPTDSLTLGSDGSLYGTTEFGGANQQLGYEYPGGTVFSVTTSGAHTVLYSFCSQTKCNDGADPVGSLVQASDGNFYGTTWLGGVYGNDANSGGTVFKITPSGAFTKLYDFCAQSNCTDGALPQAGLIQGSDENFYGTTTMGGAITPYCPAGPYPGCGTVFRLAAAPAANVSPTSLTFAAQDQGTTSLPQAVTLSNTGTAALVISSIATSGDFGQTNNCGSSLDKGANCTINVTFAPSATGSRTGTLTITDNNNLVPGSQQTVSLTGMGINPGVTFAPASLPFGNQAIHTTSAAKKVTLTSTGTTSLINISISITGANAGDFSQTNNCPASMAPGAKCTINVTFTPSILGAETASLTFADNAANSPQSVPLSGTGAQPAALMPTSLGFGNQAVSTTSTAKTVTLTNNLTTALAITSVTASGDFAQTNTCGSSVPAKGRCTISITFTPSIIGAETGTLTVTDAASNSPQTASLSGKGVVQAAVSPTSLTFASQTVGTTSAAKNVTLTNNLSTALTISSISFTGANSGDFASPTNTCGGSLAAKAHCTISVTFTPAAKGSRTATMNVNDNANNTPQTVALTGTGK